MTDNVTVPATGAAFATDDIGGLHYPIQKVAFGPLDTATLVATGTGLPVAVQGTVPVSGTVATGGLTDAQLRATALPVSGTVAVTGAYQATQPVSAASLPLPTGAALDASVTALSAKFGALGQAAMAASTPVVLASNQSAIPVTLASTTVTGSVAVTGAFFQATQPVSGTVTVGNASLAVTGTFFQATQPVSIAATVAVSGPVTDAQIRATALPVSLTSTTITGSVAVTGPLTDTQLRATPVPVSGTVTTGGLTDAQLRAAVVPVSLTSTTITGTVAATQSGTWNVTNISGTVSLPTGAATETTLAALNTKTPALGQAVMASSQPVVIASNQSAITVTVGSNSLVSTVNSTAVNLGVGAVFTGTSEDVSEYSMINATVFSSHASATDGLSLQQSSDGTNWDMVDVYTIPAATGKTFSIAVNAKFYRLVYTNGATLTTSLRIQTIHSKSPKKGSSMRPQDARTNDNDMEEMASYNSLFNGTSWDRARGTIANGQAVDVTRMPSASTTYSAAIVGLASAITATDIFTITGSATKTVRVTRIVVNGVQTTAAQVNVLIIKRSTANTAGTSTAPTRVSYDSTNAAATATVLAYTANPTLGTAVGTGSARRAFIPGAATASDAQGLEIVSGDVGQQQMTLRGIAEVLAINLNSTTVAGSAFNITVEWTES